MTQGSLSNRAMWLLLVALFFAEITASFETSMILAAMGQLLAHFGSPVKVGWLVTGYLLTATGVIAVVARFGDLLGRKKMVIILLAAAIFGSALSAFGNSFAVVLTGRVIQGLAAAILPLCFGILRHWLQPRHVPVAVGFMTTGASAGTAGGLVIGGMFVDNFGWQSIFLASMALATLSLVMVYFMVPKDEGNKSTRNINLFNGLLFVPAITALLLYVSNGKQMGWISTMQLATLATGIILMAFWIWRSLQDQNPLINVRLFANRTVLLANVIIFLFAGSALHITLFFSAFVQAPIWTGIGLGASATNAGLIKLPSNILALTAGPVAGWLTARYSGRFAMLIGLFMTVVGWVLALFFHSSILLIVLVLIVMAYGTSMAYGTVANLVLPVVPEDRASEATGMTMVMRSAGMAVGAQLIAVGFASDTVSRGSLTFPSASATLTTMGVIALVCLICSLLGLLLPKVNAFAELEKRRLAALQAD